MPSGAAGRVRRLEWLCLPSTWQEADLFWVGGLVVTGVKFYLSAGTRNQVAVTKPIANARKIAVESGSRFSSCLNAALVLYSCGVTSQKCNVSLMFRLSPCPFKYEVTSQKNCIVVVVSHSHSDFMRPDEIRVFPDKSVLLSMIFPSSPVASGCRMVLQGQLGRNRNGYRKRW